LCCNRQIAHRKKKKATEAENGMVPACARGEFSTHTFALEAPLRQQWTSSTLLDKTPTTPSTATERSATERVAWRFSKFAGRKKFAMVKRSTRHGDHFAVRAKFFHAANKGDTA
jgi:hypothetical protein